MSSLIYLNKDPMYYICNPWLQENEFMHALTVYQNNQDYYMKHGLINELKGLEHWFIHVIEPIPQKSVKIEKGIDHNKIYNESLSKWITKEFVKMRGYSFYCRNDIRSKIYVPSKDRTEIIKMLDFIRSVFEL